jgi:ribosomal protein L37AE/L43A
MREAINQKQRTHRTATSRAMQRMTKHCRKCSRGQNPKRHPMGDGTSLWVCRYCGQEHPSANYPPPTLDLAKAGGNVASLEDALTKAQATIERLTAALEKIGKISNTDPWRTFDAMIQDMQLIDDIARAALGRGE